MLMRGKKTRKKKFSFVSTSIRSMLLSIDFFAHIQYIEFSYRAAIFHGNKSDRNNSFWDCHDYLYTRFREGIKYTHK